MSAPTMFKPSTFLKILISSLFVHRLGSGVPVPGASPGSTTSTSTLRYVGILVPILARIDFAIQAGLLTSLMSLAEMRRNPWRSS